MTEQDKKNGWHVGQAIIQNGINETDQICQKTLHFMLELYADEISNVGIRNLTYGGIFMFGALSKDLKRELKKKNPNCPFMKGYYNKDFLK